VAIRLSSEKRKRAITSIKRYFAENGEDIGDLKAELFLDFWLREIAPTVYNRAIADAQGYVIGRVEELDGTCHEEEFGYWPGERKSDRRSDDDSR
jgi:uncharacterized protein (DUF2164 family)